MLNIEASEYVDTLIIIVAQPENRGNFSIEKTNSFIRVNQILLNYINPFKNNL